ncbi:MAG: tail fiber domain-containing protein [Deltaproteobacteria bacterium]|nr:MAG: tail fiber domain-containing protein [Deltaproteobacteria bacterium]
MAESESFPLAAAKYGPGGIWWRPQIRYESVQLTVSGPGGQFLVKEFHAGEPLFLNLTRAGEGPLPDGGYAYELRFTPVIASEVKARLLEVQESEDRPLLVAELMDGGLLPKEPLVQSGYFRVASGHVVVPSEDETARDERPLKGQSSHGASYVTPLDQTINDDLIVTSSLCVGFDCTVGEAFGFATIKLKEDNLRILFDDTSTGTYPANDWQIAANDSASGGASFFAIEDVTGGKTPFKVQAGAPSNSVYVDSTGRVGFRTSTPVLDLHFKTGNTPAVRLEQDGSYGFTAQTWDVAANEANFFIRDVTGVSKLPFRIQPGAPTSSLTIKSDGKVGIGTWSPAHDLDILLKNTSFVQLSNSDAPNTAKAGRMVVRHYDNTEEPVYLFGSASTATDNFVALGGGNASANAATQIDLFTAASNRTTVGTSRLTIKSNGYIGIGTTNPFYPLQMAGGAYSNGGSWINGSSREYKEDIEALSTDDAFAALQDLHPVKFAYKTDKTDKHVGFIAEEVPDLVATKDRKGLSPMDIVAVLTKVVQEQQKTISALRMELDELKERAK